MNSESLDVAACGSDFFDAETGTVLAQRVLSQSLVCKDRVSYDKFFRYIHWNLRQVWGKVYSGKVAKRILGFHKPQWWPRAYGGDTANVLVCLKYADSIGIYGKVLHHYRMSVKSISHKWLEGREKCDLILHEKTCAFILSKAGYLSDDNLKFLCGVYLYAVKDTLDVLSQAEMHVSKYLEWTLSVARLITQEDMPVIESFLKSFNPAFESFFTTGQMYEMLYSAPEVIADLAYENYVNALEKVKLLLGDGPNTKRYLIQLAQNLAALISKEEYVIYSKMYIHNLILCGEKKMARKKNGRS